MHFKLFRKNVISEYLKIISGVLSSNSMHTGRLAVLTESGVMLALALALAQVKLFQLPNGGSVSLGFWPVIILAARRGWRIGFTIGCLLGVLAAVLKPFVVHPVQFLLDYPLAYACLGISGILPWHSPVMAAIMSILANIGRLLCHVVAGAIFFASKETTDLSLSAALLASLSYNILHIGPETLIGTVLSAMLASTHSTLVARQD